MRTLLAATLLALALPLTAGAFALPAPAPATPAPGPAAVTVVASCGPAACLFEPALLQVPAGTTVVWTFVNACHTVTSGLTTETEPAEGALPGFSTLGSGKICVEDARTFQHTFGETGAFPYYCETGFHRLLGMHGAVVVV